MQNDTTPTATSSSPWPQTASEKRDFIDWQEEVGDGYTALGFREWLRNRFPQPDGTCAQHGGAWGDDETCSNCVGADGTVKFALDRTHRPKSTMTAESLAYCIEAGDVVAAEVQGSTLTLTLKNDLATLTLVSIEPLA